MPDHVRKQIRDAMATLVTGLTTTGARVFRSRLHPMSAKSLPGLIVFNGNEDISPGGGRSWERVLRINVSAYVKTAPTSIDTQLDTICKEVEIAVFVDRKLGGIAEQVDLVEIETDLAGGGDKLVGVANLAFDVTYRTAETSPDVAL